MNMRQGFAKTVLELLAEDERLMVLLCDIGVWGFRQGFADHPGRVLNIGILEQATMGVAAGLSATGLIPVVHSIAPFIVERAFEQLKIDFCYQRLGGNFVSVGASHDYAALGCTHHCPGDVGALKNLPGMEIVLPGCAGEFAVLFRQAYANGNPTYFRLSETGNSVPQPVEFGRMLALRKGREATVVALGPMLEPALAACEGLDVTLLYATTVAPFDAQTLAANCPSGKVLLCEPCFGGVLAPDVLRALFPRPVVVDFAGQDTEFSRNYGKAQEHDVALGLDAAGLRQRLARLIHAH